MGENSNQRVKWMSIITYSSCDDTLPLVLTAIFLLTLLVVLLLLLLLLLHRRGPGLQEAEALDDPALVPRRPQPLPRQVRGQGRLPPPAPRDADRRALAALALLTLWWRLLPWRLPLVVAAEGVEGRLSVAPHVPEQQRQAVGRLLWG